jgi:thioredoxin 1
MATKHSTDSNFDTDVIKAAGPIVVDFWAEWCGPCKAIAPILDKICDQFGDKVVVGKVNVDDEPNTPTKYGVRGIPTMLLFKDGELKATKVGATPKSDIVSWIKENI